jgi:transglutaminase-like putative cysteine protease
MSLYPLLYGWHWFWAGAGAVLVAGGVGALTRLRKVPAVLCFAAAVAGEFLYLNALFAGSRSLGGLIPTGSSLHHLAQLVGQARSEMAHYAPPVPEAHGIMLLTTAGIGFVAAATDVLAVRLRRPALAGLPLLVLFCVPLTTDARPAWADGTLVFCLSMAGYLALLSADTRDRLRLWGRLVHRWHDEPERRGPDTRPLTAAGRRIGLAAVALAIFLPLLVPGLRQHRLFSGSGGGGGHGYAGQISLPNPVDELNQQLHESHPQTVLTYRTSVSSPPYLPIYVLNQLSSKAWTLEAPRTTRPLGKGSLPPVPGLEPGTQGIPLTERITLSNHLSGKGGLGYLPLPSVPRSVKVSGDGWKIDPATLTVMTQHAHLAGLRYTVSSDDVEPSQQELRHASLIGASLAGDLYVPPAFNRLAGLARRVTARRTTAFGEAMALQQWFLRPGDFTYSLHVPPAASPADLIQFLKHTRTGYCQQFAFAFAVLARLLHIPARVVVGYTQGAYSGGAWQVKTSDAHAWPELFFAGAGWIRFEPTPSGTLGHGGQATAIPPSYTFSSSLPGGTTAATLPTTPRGLGKGGPNSLSAHTSQLSKQIHHPTGTSGARGAGRPTATGPIAIAVLAVLAGLLLTPRAARSLTRRWRWWRATDDAKRAHAAWCEVTDDLTDYRFGYRASESPRALAARVSRALSLGSEQRQALDRVALAEERAIYAARPAVSATLARDVAMTRRGIARASGLRARCAARLMPRSALAPARTGLQHALDVFGWIDVITSRARTRPRRQRPALS